VKNKVIQEKDIVIRFLLKPLKKDHYNYGDYYLVANSLNVRTKREKMNAITNNKNYILLRKHSNINNTK
jgi:hypothetical protein